MNRARTKRSPDLLAADPAPGRESGIGRGFAGKHPAMRRVRKSRSSVSLIACFAVVIVLGGCGNPQRTPGAGTIGTNGEIGQVQLRSVRLAQTEDAYQPGENAIVRLQMLNQSEQPDALVGARSPLAGQVRLRWDRACDGTDEVVSRIPLLADGTVPASPGQREDGTPYSLEIGGITETVRPGTTFPLTLVFERAGEVTIDAKVQATRDGDQRPPPPCQNPPPPHSTVPPGKDDETPPPPVSREITVSGTVEAGVEPGCVVLSGPGRPYLLIGGDPAVMRPGAHLVIRGVPAPGTPTTCMQGVVLHVVEALPAR